MSAVSRVCRAARWRCQGQGSPRPLGSTQDRGATSLLPPAGNPHPGTTPEPLPQPHHSSGHTACRCGMVWEAAGCGGEGQRVLVAGAGQLHRPRGSLRQAWSAPPGRDPMLTRGRSARARAACVYLCTPFSPPRHPTSPRRLSLSPSPLSPPLQELAQGMRFLSQQATAKLSARAGPTTEGQGPPGSLAGPWPRCPRSQSRQRARPTPGALLVLPSPSLVSVKLLLRLYLQQQQQSQS